MSGHYSFGRFGGSFFVFAVSKDKSFSDFAIFFGFFSDSFLAVLDVFLPVFAGDHLVPFLSFT